MLQPLQWSIASNLNKGDIQVKHFSYKIRKVWLYLKKYYVGFTKNEIDIEMQSNVRVKKFTYKTKKKNTSEIHVGWRRHVPLVSITMNNITSVCVIVHIQLEGVVSAC